MDNQQYLNELKQALALHSKQLRQLDVALRAARAELAELEAHTRMRRGAATEPLRNRVHALRLDRHQLAARIAACYTKILAHLQTRIDIYSECRFLGRPDSMATKLTLYAQLRDLRADMRLGAWVR